MTMDEYQHIERFYDYITNTCDWIIMILEVEELII